MTHRHSLVTNITFSSQLSVDNDVEDDLHQHVIGALQRLPLGHAKPRPAGDLQCLPDSCALGITKPAPGPLGLPALQEFPPREVLPVGQRHLQVLHQPVEGEVHLPGRGEPADRSLREHPALCVETTLANKQF